MKKFVTEKTAIREIEKPNIMANNIVKMYRQCNQDDVSEGLTWYPRAYEIAKYWSHKYGTTIEIIAGIISALSPGTNWAQNIVDAENLLESLTNKNKDPYKTTVTTYSNGNRNKAIRIFNDRLGMKQIYELLLGSSQKFNKTSRFFVNIIRPQNTRFVTVDRHSFRVAFNAQQAPQICITEKRYRNIETAYKLAAKKVKLRPNEIQAITWIYYRENYLDKLVLKPALKLDRFIYGQVIYQRKRSAYEDNIPF